MKKYLFLILLAAFVSCQVSPELREVTIVSYNVENLFDTVDDPKVNDEAFLPESEKQWTEERYHKKLNDIARVLTSINPNDLPEVIGLAEIENKQVLEDLVATDAMRAGNYEIVHQGSPDKRGIDVALLYRPAEFKLKNFEVLTVDPGFRTRDILHVTGQFQGETFHFFVNHWPSRIGGLEKSEPNRVVAAEVLAARVGEIRQKDPQANIVIMGDMNDEPHNKSIAEVLGAGEPGSNSELVNLMLPDADAKKGTYNYRGNWNMLDNLIVSSNLLDQDGFKVEGGKGFIFSKEWMEYKNKKGEMSPNRTYGGPNYYGGVSDHFPVYFEMRK